MRVLIDYVPNNYRYKHPSIRCLSNHSTTINNNTNTNRSNSGGVGPLITIHHHVWEKDEFQQNEYRHEQGMNRCFRKELPDRYDYTPDTPSLLDLWGLYLHINQLIVLHQHQCIQALVTIPSASYAVAVVLYIAEFTTARSNRHAALDATPITAVNTTNDRHNSSIPSFHGLLLPPEMQVYRKNHSM